MGRRAKYLSLDEKSSAKRESDLKYINSPHGKTVRTTYRESSQRRKQSRSKYENKTLLQLPPPIKTMLELYAKPLPTGSHLYKEALGSAVALDESDLARWKREPPFEQDDDRMDPHSLGHSLTRGRDDVLLLLREEVWEMLKSWERVQKILHEGFYHPNHQPREYSMLEHYLQWLARTICHLYYHSFLDE
ncbi:hypothetical protein R3P38DRAFT_3327863 [Favolaschia claudopus]|uniref:Uncharacterized protein n=1 Tax=Favolaschia claudopus TaxID=2862362 RepID=A0AAW0A2Z5_9AGAR